MLPANISFVAKESRSFHPMAAAFEKNSVPVRFDVRAGNKIFWLPEQEVREKKISNNLSILNKK